MNDFFGSVWWMIVSIGVLVTFHEFGHFWVARRNGVRVLRFSVGFGKPLWMRRGKDGTEYVIAAIPSRCRSAPPTARPPAAAWTCRGCRLNSRMRARSRSWD